MNIEFIKGYMIAEDGLVTSLNYKNTGIAKALSQATGTSGYKYVSTPKGRRKSQNHLVHRLVAIAFIPNPDNKKYVNHRDGNKNNNDISNLEWVTASENTIHGFENGLMRVGAEHHMSTPVRCIDTGTVYNTAKAANAAYTKGKPNGSNIARVCKGTQKKAFGLNWEFIN